MRSVPVVVMAGAVWLFSAGCGGGGEVPVPGAGGAADAEAQVDGATGGTGGTGSQPDAGGSGGSVSKDGGPEDSSDDGADSWDGDFDSSDGAQEGGEDAGDGNGDADGAAGQCSQCHGGPQNAAPPIDLKKHTETTYAGVGAHQSHLALSPWHRQVQCTDCHVVPAQPSWDPAVPTHLNGTNDLVWGTIAGQPTYDTGPRACTGAYCHGATLDADLPAAVSNRTPVWTQVDGTQSQCGLSCHTLPPGGTHPGSDKCEQCHASVVLSYTATTPPSVVWADPGLHINGTVELDGMTCTSCHGDPASNNAAPPLGTHGQTDPSDPAVGAHAQHLTPSAWHRNGVCEDCHVVPAEQNHGDGHLDLTWGAPANADGATPAFDSSSVTCQSMYCHGSTLLAAVSGGTSEREPLWTKVDGTFGACGTACHTNPPGEHHPSSLDCPKCHTESIATYTPGNPPTVTWLDASLHIDGKVDLKGVACTSCHGDPVTKVSAPPLGTQGETATTEPSVGAHLQHLGSSTWHRDGQCEDCHIVPEEQSHADGVIGMVWSGPSAASGASPAFDFGTNTCASVYCHGSTLGAPKAGGAVNRTPLWTVVDGTYAECGTTCHTNPPGGTHTAGTGCPNCHGVVLAAFVPGSPPQVTWADASRHIDGKIDAAPVGCTSCHGNPAANLSAPPRGTHGETATTEAAVGAHAQHLGTSVWHREGQCEDCHVVPVSQSHEDGKLDLAWGSPSNADGAFTAFSGANLTCTNTYCHGATLLGPKAGGSISRSPVWTTVNGSFDVCGSTCHTLPPGGTHPTGTDCQTCHGAVITTFAPGNPPSVIWTDPSLHIDGKLDLSGLGCTSCHGNKATDNPAPPTGTHGETVSTQKAVGAHAQHLSISPWHRPGKCTDCHATPVSNLHADGTVNFAWGDPSTADGALPGYTAASGTCANTYCHGATLHPAKLGGTVSRVPPWTVVNGTYDACGTTCHTNPPGGTHPTSPICQNCHAEVIASFVAGNPPTVVWANADLHVDGKINQSTLNCTSCHGDPAKNQSAPPTGTLGETATSTRAVGAHAQHLGASAWHRAGACADCHVVPTATTHQDGAVGLAWGAPGNADGASTAYAAATLTCTNNYCHGTTLMGAKGGGTVSRSPVWTTVNGTFDGCGTTCHTNPPGGSHPAKTACPSCHQSVIKSYVPGNPPVATWADPALHINGTVDLAGLTCTSCHGDTATTNAAPPLGTHDETLSTQMAVGAHRQHLGASTWHRAGQCVDCHATPSGNLHTSGTTEFSWGAPSNVDGASTAFSAVNGACSNNYCHGSTLLGANAGGSVSRTPVWTTVNGSFDVCGNTCHTNPPGGTHPAASNCQNCHDQVISAFALGNPPTVAWANPNLHVDGTVQTSSLTCTSCHGNKAANDPAPPLGTLGETATTSPGVGAHAEHLGVSDWHRTGQCVDCHATQVSMYHFNGAVDFSWGAPSTASGAVPSYDTTAHTCATTYCHGVTLSGAKAGGTVSRTPVWNAVSGAWDACGTTCHTNPPGGTHPVSTACQLCHGTVVATFAPGNPPAVVWANKDLHVNGAVDVNTLTCTSCHGNAATNAAPPLGTLGETGTSAQAVGAHQQHLGTSTWHRDGLCADCHTSPSSMTHANGTDDLTWTSPSNAGGAVPAYSSATSACTGTYCHGVTLQAAKAGGAVQRAPVWTTVNGSLSACGSTCHTNPPGGTHVVHTDCRICHQAVVATFDSATNATTWANRALHVNGVIDSNVYHDLANWRSPRNNANHHGSTYFVTNQQRDEHNVVCSQCHGANLDGGTVNVSCSNTTAGCHNGRDWRSCTFCHGTPPSQNNPPLGVGGETTNTTLAVGRHVAHLTASSTHVAFACGTCHTVPAAGTIAHTTGYIPSVSLATAGHHGDVMFSVPAAGMTWNVNGTQGTTVTARGTCTGACHSNGNGGAPAVTPYWAGGAWTVGGCGTCHAASPTTGQHTRHVGGQGLACTECHPASSGATHMNGVKDVLPSIVDPNNGGSVTSVAPPSTKCGTVRGCFGNCHSQSHGSSATTAYCWR